MDALGLGILEREMNQDRRVLANAATNAVRRIKEEGPGSAEACAYELARFYTVLEKMFERVCEAFENHFERRGDFHERLLQRLAMDLPGLRPRLVPDDALEPLRELKGFRHVVRHAYELTLRPDRLSDLAALAERMSAANEVWCREFFAGVRREQGWP